MTQTNKQTAMQALVDLLKVKDAYKECMPYIIDIIEEVYLLMEKEQIEDAHIEGQRLFDKYQHTQWTTDQAEQYYNETYGK